MNTTKGFFRDIDWQSVTRRLLFVLVSAIIVVSSWLTLSNLNRNACSDAVGSVGKVLIDVSVSDTLTRGMDDKLNRVLHDLLQIKQDSITVEVSKIHSSQP